MYLKNTMCKDNKKKTPLNKLHSPYKHFKLCVKTDKMSYRLPKAKCRNVGT